MQRTDTPRPRRKLLRALAAGAVAIALPGVPRAQPASAQALREGLAQRLAGPEQRIRALGVVREGQLLHEYHRPGLAPDQAHAVRSITKSVVSLLACIAIAERRLPSPDRPMLELLPELADPALDPQVRQITWSHCLSLSTGFAPLSPNESGDYGRFLEYYHRPDGMRQAFQRPLAHAPGSRWYYSNLDSQLAGRVLSQAIGRTAPAGTTEAAAFQAWAGRALFEPLGMQEVRWQSNTAGVPNCASGLSLRLRDLLALGQLVVQQGRWQSQPLVSADHLAQATTARVDTSIALRDGFIRYGWLWWLSRTPEGNLPAVYAAGYGGQFIYLVPQRQIVIAAVSETDDADHARGSARTARVIRDWALPLAGT